MFDKWTGKAERISSPRAPRSCVESWWTRHASAQRPKRGGGLERFDIDDVLSVSHSKDARLVALDDALTELQVVDPRRARIVELRYFGGLSVEETAGALGISEETVTRDWRLARGWLLAQISVGN